MSTGVSQIVSWGMRQITAQKCELAGLADRAGWPASCSRASSFNKELAMNKMNKTNLKGKLTLQSETLVRLDPVPLDEVNGGTNPTVTTITVTTVTTSLQSNPLIGCK
jgi:hypothetical protein